MLLPLLDSNQECLADPSESKSDVLANYTKGQYVCRLQRSRTFPCWVRASRTTDMLEGNMLTQFLFNSVVPQVEFESTYTIPSRWRLYQHLPTRAFLTHLCTALKCLLFVNDLVCYLSDVLHPNLDYHVPSSSTLVVDIRFVWHSVTKVSVDYVCVQQLY